MSVEYEPVAGFSIPVTDELKQKVKRLVEGINNWEERFQSEFDALGVKSQEVGSSWTGEIEYVPLYVPDNAVDLDKNIAAWLSNVNNKLQTSFEIKDVTFFKDLKVW